MLKYLPIFLLCYFISAYSYAEKPPKAIKTISTECKCLALTFDDGPKSNFTQPILDILAQQKIKATFFQIGKNINKAPQLTRLVASQGHELANHSMTHPRLPKLASEVEIKDEIQSVQALLTQITGITPTAFRAPYLKFDKRVWLELSTLNLPAYNANIYGDYKGDGDLNDAKIAAQHVQTLVNKIKSGDIILMHERGITLHYLELFISTLKQQGYTFLTISEMVAADK